MSNNWEKRQYIALGPQVRIESCNPTVGDNGSVVYDIYGVSDKGDVCLAGMTEGGNYRIYGDKCIELIGGGISGRGGVDVMITGKQGSVCITAMENGDVRVNGNNLVFNAKENITFKCGGNFEVDASKKIDLKAKEAYCVAPHSYGPDCIATKTNETFLTRVYSGLAAESIAVAASVGAGGIGSKLAAGVMKEGIDNLREGFGV